MNEYLWGIFFAIIIATGLAFFHLLLSVAVGPGKRTNPAKEEPFECGIPSDSDVPHGRVPVRFFRIALLFVIFDIEVAFFYPWAVIYRKLALFGFLEMLVFGIFLIAGYCYIIGKGMLRWE